MLTVVIIAIVLGAIWAFIKNDWCLVIPKAILNTLLILLVYGLLALLFISGNMRMEKDIVSETVFPVVHTIRFQEGGTRRESIDDRVRVFYNDNGEVKEAVLSIKDVSVFPADREEIKAVEYRVRLAKNEHMNNFLKFIFVSNHTTYVEYELSYTERE